MTATQGDIIIDGGNSEYQDSIRRTNVSCCSSSLLNSIVSHCWKTCSLHSSFHDFYLLHWFVAVLQALSDKGILFVGSGVSGGEEGARYGPSIMPGGNPAAWPAIKPIFQVYSIVLCTCQ